MKNRLKYLCGIALAVLLAFTAVFAYQHYTKQDDDNSLSDLEASVKAQLGQLDNKTDEEIQAELDRVVEENMFHIAINGFPVFETGTSEGNLEIENVPNNHYSMDVQIALSDTGELIYESGLIEPNYHIQSDTLSKALEAGEYPCTATFKAYDTDTKQEIGSTGCEITVYVLN
jgi:hypothetical protein